MSVSQQTLTQRAQPRQLQDAMQSAATEPVRRHSLYMADDTSASAYQPPTTERRPSFTRAQSLMEPGRPAGSTVALSPSSSVAHQQAYEARGSAVGTATLSPAGSPALGTKHLTPDRSSSIMGQSPLTVTRPTPTAAGEQPRPSLVGDALRRANMSVDSLATPVHPSMMRLPALQEGIDLDQDEGPPQQTAPQTPPRRQLTPPPPSPPPAQDVVYNAAAAMLRASLRAPRDAGVGLTDPPLSTAPPRRTPRRCDYVHYEDPLPGGGAGMGASRAVTDTRGVEDEPHFDNYDVDVDMSPGPIPSVLLSASPRKDKDAALPTEERGMAERRASGSLAQLLQVGTASWLTGECCCSEAPAAAGVAGRGGTRRALRVSD
jgi:hypothetical protein